MDEMDKRERANEEKTGQMLDTLLSAYSNVEPRPGMEIRVLAGLRAAAQAPAPRWNTTWLWSVAGVAAIAAVIIAVYLWPASTAPPRPALKAQVPAPYVQEKPEAPPQQPAVKPVPRAPLPRPPQLAARVDVRQEVFPAPVALSDQEKLLLKYLSGTPREEVVARSHPDDAPEDDGEPLNPQVQQLRSTEGFSTR